MLFFLDSADGAEIESFWSTGLIDGVTTNPSIVAAANRNREVLIRDICRVVDGPVSVAVTGRSAEEMLAESQTLRSISDQIVIKLPANRQGFDALSKLAPMGVPINLTAVYTFSQVMIAAKLGATFISVFVGRLDAAGGNGRELMRDSVSFLSQSGLPAKLLAASMRSAQYVEAAGRAGAHVATVTPDVFRSMMMSELSDSAAEAFQRDAKGNQ